jgi:hypothetical protein
VEKSIGSADVLGAQEQSSPDLITLIKVGEDAVIAQEEELILKQQNLK